MLATSCVAALGDLDDYAFEARAGRPADGGAFDEQPSDQRDADPLVTFVDPQRCSSGARRCVRDSVQTCRDGAWDAALPCSEPNPVCNGGVCARWRLSGTLASLPATLAATSFRLVEQGFEGNGTSCGIVGGTSLCVTGGLRP